MRNLKEEREIKRYSDVYSDERRNQGWWYFTTHGVQPGSVPKGVNILEVRDTPNGTYFRADAILNTSELEYYDIKERVPKNESLKEEKEVSDMCSACCQIDFFHTKDYDEDVLRDAITSALEEQGCSWSGYMDFYDFTDDYSPSDRLGKKYATGFRFDVFHREGQFDPEKLVAPINKALYKMGCRWYKDIQVEDNTDAYGDDIDDYFGESINRKSGKRLMEAPNDEKEAEDKAEVDPDKGSGDAEKEQKIKQKYLEFIKQLKSAKDYNSYLQLLRKICQDDNSRKILFWGIQKGIDGNGQNAVKGQVKVTALLPTQNEIGVNDSLAYPLEKDPSGIPKLFKNPVQVGPNPIVVFNDGARNYVLDGHHRWSQVYMFNPNATMSAFILKKGFATGPVGALKNLQLIIGAGTGNVPSSDANGINIYTASEDQLKNWIAQRLKNSIGQRALEIFNKATGQQLDANGLLEYFMKNILTLKKTTGTWAKKMPPRSEMPQTNKGPDGVAGTVGYADNVVTESKKPVNTKINIRESLNKYDLRTDNKYDLRNLYDACIMTDKERRIIAEMIAKNARANVLYEALMNKFEGKELEEAYDDAEYMKNRYPQGGDNPKNPGESNIEWVSRWVEKWYPEREYGKIDLKETPNGGIEIFFVEFPEGLWDDEYESAESEFIDLVKEDFGVEPYIVRKTSRGGDEWKSYYIPMEKQIKGQMSFIDPWTGGVKGFDESLKEAIQPSHLKNLLVNFFNSNFGGYGDPDNKVLSVDDVDINYRNRVIEIHTMTFEDSSYNFYKDYENYQEVDMDDLSAFLWGKAWVSDDHEESLKESKQNLTLLYKNMGGSIWKSTGKSGERELHIIDDKKGKCVKVLDGSKYSKKDYDDLIRQYVGGSKNESLKEGVNDRLRQIAEPLANALDELTDRDDGFYITYSIGMDDNGTVTGGVDFELFQSSRTEEEAKAEIERVFDENGFELDRRYKTNPGKTLFGRTHYQIIEKGDYTPKLTRDDMNAGQWYEGLEEDTNFGGRCYTVTFNTKWGGAIKSLEKDFKDLQPALAYAKGEDEDLLWVIKDEKGNIVRKGWGSHSTPRR